MSKVQMFPHKIVTLLLADVTYLVSTYTEKYRLHYETATYDKIIQTKDFHSNGHYYRADHYIIKFG